MRRRCKWIRGLTHRGSLAPQRRVRCSNIDDRHFEKEKKMNAKLLLVLGILFVPLPVRAEMFVNASTDYCLDTDGRAVNGGAVRMWRCVKHTNQTWTVVKVGSSHFRLKNATSNFCLDTDGSRANGGQVRMWSCVSHPNQLCEILRLPNGGYRLKNKASGFCLDTDGRKANGAQVRMWECVSHPHQTWKKSVWID